MKEKETNEELASSYDAESEIEENIDNKPIKDNDSEIITEQLTTIVEIDDEETIKQ